MPTVQVGPMAASNAKANTRGTHYALRSLEGLKKKSDINVK